MIDENEPNGKKSGLYWDNPVAKDVLKTAESVVAADLVRDYMEHYKLDYSLSIFIPEAGLKVDPIDRDAVSAKAGISEPRQDEPLLVSLLKMKESGVSAPVQERPATSEWKKEPEQEKVEPIELIEKKLEPIVKEDALDNLVQDFSPE